MVNNCFAIELNDLISVSCYEATIAWAPLGVVIRDKMFKISSDKKLSAQQAIVELKKFSVELDEMEGQVFRIVSRDRDRLFKRFGSMLSVDIYTTIHAQMAKTAFVVANEYPLLSSEALTSKFNTECIININEGIETVKKSKGMK